MTLPRIGITLGDPSGIGPEVTHAALRDPRVLERAEVVLFGDVSHAAEDVETAVVSELPLSQRWPGKPHRAGGRAQYDYVLAAIEAAQRGELDGLCTAPVSKEAINTAGVKFSGHTELLAAKFKAEVMMLMKGPKLSVALATNHLPIAKVPRALTVPKLTKQLQFLHHHLGVLLGRAPRIAVCGLNPHAGDGGVLGKEEQRIISPAIARAKELGVDVHGPFAADGLFAGLTTRAFGFDVALAMFHDQGLVATKLLDFEHTVNVTLGLPVPRTSPDHGVAYDIAGSGRADPEPMVAALLEVISQVELKSKFTRR